MALGGCMAYKVEFQDSPALTGSTMAHSGLAHSGLSQRMLCLRPREAVSSSICRPTKRTRTQSTMCSAASVPFSKYQGLGNDFILIDNRQQPEPVISSEQAKQLCDRHFGIGADGVIFALPANGHRDVDYAMRIYNSDGSEPEMCGNGIRCLARFVADVERSGPTRHRVHTGAGLIQPSLLDDGRVCVDMGTPITAPHQVPTSLEATLQGGPVGEAVVAQQLQAGGSAWTATCVSMGNPHAVIFQQNGSELKVDEIDPLLEQLGPHFEGHPAFPARTNTHFVEALSRRHLRMTVWERGAGRTLACGTGACAVVVAAVLEGRCEHSCRVDLPGGPLEIEWREADGHVYMTGPAELAFTGTVPL